MLVIGIICRKKSSQISRTKEGQQSQRSRWIKNTSQFTHRAAASWRRGTCRSIIHATRLYNEISQVTTAEPRVCPPHKWIHNLISSKAVIRKIQSLKGNQSNNSKFASMKFHSMQKKKKRPRENPKIVKTVFEIKALENIKLKLKNSLRWTSP